MLTRQEYVAICETCVKHKGDFKRGIVCSLTDDYANFDTTCPHYEKDELAVKRIARMKQHIQSESASTSGVFEAEAKMLNSGLWGGILMIVGGIVWLIVGLAINRIFFYPFFLIIAGIVVLVKAANKQVKKTQRRNTSDVLDDKNDLEVL